MIENIWQAISTFVVTLGNTRVQGWQQMEPLFMGVGLQIGLILLLVLVYYVFRGSKFVVAFELFFESMYKFFEEIIGVHSPRRVKRYIISLFLLILIMNLSGWFLDIFRSSSILLTSEQRAMLEHYIVAPSSMIEFNVAMAGISILVSLILQFKRLGGIKFVHEYVPILGKGILDVEKGGMKVLVYWPMKIFAKVFDIGISLFVGLLDIIGIGAKVVSLSARLFGNMLSGGILLGLLAVATASMMHKAFGIESAVLTPLILFVQGLLVVVIQAFVFSLLCAIFVKISQE